MKDNNLVQQLRMLLSRANAARDAKHDLRLKAECQAAQSSMRLLRWPRRVPRTEATHRMKQIRQFTHSDGHVVLTSHDKPALIVLDVERCLRMLYGARRLAQLLMASNLVEVARAVSAADTIGSLARQTTNRRELMPTATLADTDAGDGGQPDVSSRLRQS